MTLTMSSGARGVQFLGALMALAGVVLAAFSNYCGSGLHLQVGAAAVALDVGALLARRSLVALPLALAKGAVLFLGLATLLSCAPFVPDPPPLVPQGIAFAVLMASILPSITGAIMLRFAR